MYDNDSSTPDDRIRVLREELREYELVVPMTPEEREIVRSRVESGHSVREAKESCYLKPGYILEGLDFLDVYRIDRFITETIIDAHMGRKGTCVDKNYGRICPAASEEELPFLSDDDDSEGKTAGDPVQKELQELRRRLYWLWAYINEEDEYEEAAEYVADHLGIRTPFEI